MILLYSQIITPRLQYICDFIGNEILGKPFEVTTDAEKFKNYNGPKINYNNETISNFEFRISESKLFFEKNIREQSIQCFNVNGYKAFFKTNNSDFSFDIFAASFYLLSRYEEYRPHQKDLYDRYAHQNSLAFNENFLHLPLINLWLQDFGKALIDKFPNLKLRVSACKFLPTYDIDIAYSYKHKGFWRTTGGIFKTISSGQGHEISNRIKVLNEKQQDPFDCYDWLNALHAKHKLKPYYFFHVAARTSRYDKNISPANKQMQELIHRHAEQYKIGIHPSWQSGDDPSLLKKEVRALENISGQAIIISRQHFIRFALPQTFRQLIDAGIKEDYSMGYGSINGFRASVASPFYWYDLEKEEQTNLLLYPFCYMEANSFFEQRLTAHQALEEMLQYYSVIESVNGFMITIWHNSFLGTEKMFSGWKETYETFISEVCLSGDSAAGTDDEIL